MRRLAVRVLIALGLLACAGDESNWPAPINLVVAQQGTAAALSWEGANGADHFEIQRSDNIDNSFRKWATVDGGRRYYSDFTVQSKHQYYYRVRAWYKTDGDPKSSDYTRSVGIYIQ